MGNRMTMEDQIIELRMASKQMKRQSQKCSKQEKAEQMKVKKAIEQGDKERAKIHAENSIRNKSNSINFLRLASRMESIVQRLQTAQSIKTMSKSMMTTTKIMQTALSSMNVEKISATMDTFEKQFEELDIQSAVMEDSVKQANANTIKEDQVENLMRQVADEHNLKMEDDMLDAPSNKLQEKDEKKVEEKSLEDRLNALQDL
mmetsp:Transcript_23332/g.32627  ORF Transcript_23332/g.32627 Transcript_23332/m.32627 type:complete len:203 (-) Transcript_23332:195-803(-)|eukprot:CAMPEP_0185251366 /NCGR_PEP_ID=MMETSP1359-20130426/776_1 /TAXON_ID=552665 /ORGANISM="Bigelowiella longifila, Strain CCMP242" /LENGTH=202 /DNA_ID=CAMNT_0027833227 /DNA_START=96 /DNA_END=704 /DNA_ORIENTATION=-